MDDYLETIREVERRIQQAEASVGDHPLPDLDRPIGVPAAYVTMPVSCSIFSVWPIREMSPV